MNAAEANVLLTKAALVDRWMKFGTPQELAAAAKEWAIVLAAVPLDIALEALAAHYSTERRSIMPADIVDFAPPLRSSSHAGNITEQRLARERAEITS
ncbi:hypothetical protein [Microbacterium maritypicum]|uniref:Uncharacterized protein n=2 Tax=Microbacterium maritypicum TaxID=33918 RepID=A0ACD4B8X6_MICMQ|nr:hypothetical protein [Microbacterium liquefaciens]UTT53780.1 hypothetical protein NMQ05_04155 [Microbacterium liquefaciens]UTT53845.1 hypothetical protein NMQ05_04485 [Microbacterium liquefaciens]